MAGVKKLLMLVLVIVIFIVLSLSAAGCTYSKIGTDVQDNEQNVETIYSPGFDYKNGVISEADYSRSADMHGTWDCQGQIYYDKSGRMTDNSYYVTHGGQDHIFLYNGDSKMPWACIYWDSFYNGFEQIYLFMPNEK